MSASGPFPARHPPDSVRKALMEGARYLDVRTPEEYELGHVPGAYNIPYQLGSNAGLRPNPEFLSSAQTLLGRQPGRWIVGCRSGKRALAAIEQLKLAHLELDECSWDGHRDAFGELTPGWQRRGFPVETGVPEGRNYAALTLTSTQPTQERSESGAK